MLKSVSNAKRNNLAELVIKEAAAETAILLLSTSLVLSTVLNLTVER